jgi:hypothetical protein
MSEARIIAATRAVAYQRLSPVISSSLLQAKVTRRTVGDHYELVTLISRMILGRDDERQTISVWM